MKQIQAVILKNEKIGSGFFRMRIASSYLAKESKPGQFVEVRCAGETEPLLRRPLGIHRIVKGGIELLYEAVGKGTGLLSEMKKGEMADLIGPLGNGFDIPSRAGAAILVAGGNGVAPLLALAEQLLAGLPVSRFAGLQVFIGACTKDHILCAKEFKKIGCKVLVATEDGSQGYKGLVTDLLKKELSNRHTGTPAHRHTIYACGPAGMLKAVSEIAHDNHIPCQVSLEERMACGVGVCLGCPVRVLVGQRVSGLAGLPAHPRTRAPANYTYKMVCKDGPVFDAAEIAW
ncbi:MAG: dihydroorotate dehydrogenase electron transfer subunit [Candidatus Omnitrophota bacterium]|nr:dihydroorotate dehydrogenase electron transfer subunit [Candidatus Omnitrophota bacterium]